MVLKAYVNFLLGFNIYLTTFKLFKRLPNSFCTITIALEFVATFKIKYSKQRCKILFIVKACLFPL